MADKTAEDFPLHKAVFEGNLRKVSSCLRSCDIEEQDIHGNTPLHIAVLLGRRECVYLLLAHGATTKIKNNLGWSPLAEAISYGDRQIITSILKKLKGQSREGINERRPQLINALKELGDFYVEIAWDFQSWVPLLSRILPSDTCKIYKKGCSIRMDSTLVDFTDMKWQRGDVTFIFNGDAKGKHSFAVLDNERKVFQRLRTEETESEIEEEVDLLMSSDIVSVYMSTKPITFAKSQAGWFWRADRQEMVGPYLSDIYCVNGMMLISKKRREHLTEEDLVKNKALMESISKGGNLIENIPEMSRRDSLHPPPKPEIGWSEYVRYDTQNLPHLGRPLVMKEEKKPVKAYVAMSEEFPLSLDVVLNVLEVIAPFKHFNKLKEFVAMKLPPGFPVRIEIPVFPTITAKITFQDFKYCNDIPTSMFFIPRDYKEDPNRFPDL
ncbi:ankyrin repeat domain-containing protein 13C-B [Exaiptasia diaphana]|uniref:Ankyrin repeat domain-containing protein n=1 Tax=Exaiptasia diaphana TaxID=2652724 RepID=A0A913WSK4_EXADI|nr:ankyrin repeat domain-containing protein 13C-B [Exaiptasia diaphana]KXJ18332.1 Ankyrin repeat domain-containing protein 13C-B [Exaiptasia diaphana]